MIQINKFIFFVLAGLLLTGYASSQTLHIYGGENQNVYLGCLNCNRHESNSIWNAYGTYGSKYNSVSIWNTYGIYGSKYSSVSPWNSYSNYPPIIVDREGNFYGYFTMHKYKSNRAEFSLVEIIYKFHEVIRDDVSKWYNEIFK